jgi:hypothetical protein
VDDCNLAGSLMAGLWPLGTLRTLSIRWCHLVDLPESTSLASASPFALL